MTETFERYEKKYLLSPAACDALCARLTPYITPDAYGAYTVCNLYFDTPDYRLIRASIEGPAYKEKLRLRSYGVPDTDAPVFLELKKKYAGVVYKRRITAPLGAVKAGELSDSQILREIGWFMRMYQNPTPRVYIAYDRQAFCGVEEPGLRLTFDRNIRWRQSALELSKGTWGNPLLARGEVLLEIKIPGAMPVWLCRMLSDLEIYPTSFSKYGMCYKNCLIRQKEETACA